MYILGLEIHLFQVVLCLICTSMPVQVVNIDGDLTRATRQQRHNTHAAACSWQQQHANCALNAQHAAISAPSASSSKQKVSKA